MENYHKTVEVFHENGIAVLGTFIFGLDGDTLDTFVDTVQFIKNSQIDMVNLNMLYPYPGTPFRSRLEKEGRLLPEASDWNSFRYNKAVFIPKNMSPQQLMEGFEWSTKELATREEIAKRVHRAIVKNIYPRYVFSQNMRLREHVINMFGDGWDN